MADEVRSIWNVRVVLADKRVVFSRNVGDSYHVAAWWIYENISVIKAVIEQHIDDRPQVVVKDVFVSEDN